MKTLTKILAILGCITTMPLLYLLFTYLDSEGIVEFRRHPGKEFYYTADLKNMSLPVWQVTNAIPVTPDQAVLAATRYLATKYPDIASWNLDSIDLSNDQGAWVYRISLVDRHSSGINFESVRVLMDGNVWKPSPERKQ